MQNLVLLEYNLGHNLWMAIVLGRNNPQVFHNSDQIPFQLYCHPPHLSSNADQLNQFLLGLLHLKVVIVLTQFLILDPPFHFQL